MFNEELNIEHAIDAAVESLEKYAGDYEIVIVDDASTVRPKGRCARSTRTSTTRSSVCSSAGRTATSTSRSSC
jgi:hypothetical protein